MQKAEKRKWLTFALCVFLIAAVLVAVSLFISIYPDTCSKNELTGYKECIARHIPMFIFPSVGRFLEDHDGAIVAIATIFIAWFTYQLRRAIVGLKDSTDKLWRASEKQLRTTQRSYIAVEPDGVRPLHPQPFAIGRIKIRNVGGVPARKVRWFVHQGTAGAMHKDFPIEEKESGQSNVLPPGVAMDFSQNNTQLSATDAKEVRDNTRAYYVWGIVRYTDVFGGDRFTKFCHRYGAYSHFQIADGKYVGNAELRADGAKYHQWGNDTDEVP
jgi:hypothetical protein